VAIAYAREGADVVINYLPEEQPDADEVIKLIEGVRMDSLNCWRPALLTRISRPPNLSTACFTSC
jgi:NAD(P)-dependent dehydrogenase (short-subunit alcohol dehydrogenase family)